MNKIEQNTSDWLEMRKNYVGASDAPVIMGVSPYKTLLQLWEEKVGEEIKEINTYAIERGKSLEPIARDRYEEVMGYKCPAEVVFHPSNPVMMASLDGINREKGIVLEIKCPGKKDHDTAVKGVIPKKYYPQLQQQLACSGLNLLHYFSFDGKNGVVIPVVRDDKYIKELETKIGEFWNHVLTFTPPEREDAETIYRDEIEWIEAENELLLVQDLILELQEKEERCKKRLIELSLGCRCRGDVYSVTSYKKAGSVNYSKIPELFGVELDKYRKPDQTINRVSKII